MLICRDYTR